MGTICYLIIRAKIFWMYFIWFWWEIVLKWIWESFVEKFECISVLNLKVFMKISICYTSYLQVWLKMYDPWNCINVPYRALSSPFIDNLSSNLSSGEEWPLWEKFGFIRTTLFILDIVEMLKLNSCFNYFEFRVTWTITLWLMY